MIPRSDAGDGNQQPSRSAVDPVVDRGQEGSTRDPEDVMCDGNGECFRLEAELTRLRSALQTAQEEIAGLKTDKAFWDLMTTNDRVQDLEAKLQTAEQERDKAHAAFTSASEYGVKWQREKLAAESQLSTLLAAIDPSNALKGDVTATSALAEAHRSDSEQVDVYAAENVALLAARDRLVEQWTKEAATLSDEHDDGFYSPRENLLRRAKALSTLGSQA